METMTASTGHELTDAEPNSVYEQKHQTDAALIKHSQPHQGETAKIQRGIFLTLVAGMPKTQQSGLSLIW